MWPCVSHRERQQLEGLRFLLSFFPNCLSCEWMQGNGGTSLWTAAAGRTTWQLRAGAQRIYNVPVCASVCWGKLAAESLPVANSDFSCGSICEGQTHKHTHWVMHRGDVALRVRLSDFLSFSEWSEPKYAVCVHVCKCARDRKAAGDHEQWPVTYWRSRTHQSDEQVLTRVLPV